MERIDGSKVWPTLTAEVQAEIGATAIELVAAQAGMCEATTFRDERAYESALSRAMDALDTAVLETVPALIAGGPVPIPAAAGQVCRVCRQSEHEQYQPCRSWAEEDLCTACVDNGGTER